MVTTQQPYKHTFEIRTWMWFMIPLAVLIRLVCRLAYWYSRDLSVIEAENLINAFGVEAYKRPENPRFLSYYDQRSQQKGALARWFYDTFGNDDDGIGGDQNVKVGSGWKHEIWWWIRNPCHNACFYLYGIPDAHTCYKVNGGKHIIRDADGWILAQGRSFRFGYMGHRFGSFGSIGFAFRISRYK